MRLLEVGGLGVTCLGGDAVVRGVGLRVGGGAVVGGLGLRVGAGQKDSMLNTRKEVDR